MSWRGAKAAESQRQQGKQLLSLFCLTQPPHHTLSHPLTPTHPNNTPPHPHSPNPVPRHLDPSVTPCPRDQRRWRDKLRDGEERDKGREMTASPSPSRLTTQKLTRLGNVLFFCFLQSPKAKINHMTNKKKVALTADTRPDLLSDGSVQLEPDQSLPHTHPAPSRVQHSK